MENQSLEMPKDKLVKSFPPPDAPTHSLFFQGAQILCKKLGNAALKFLKIGFVFFNLKIYVFIVCKILLNQKYVIPWIKKKQQKKTKKLSIYKEDIPFGILLWLWEAMML